MATSSITETLRVNNPKMLEAYAEALERAETEPVSPSPAPVYEEVTDEEGIRDILARNLENWGKKST